jgi:YggT family protein
MGTAVLVNFINLFAFVFNILLLARVLMSWVNPHPSGGIGGLLVDLTEPVLAPIRRVLPRSQMLDFSPLVAFLLLQLLALLANRALSG